MSASNSKAVIEFNGVGLRYPLHSVRHARGFAHLLSGRFKEDFWALRNVSFQIEAGGILGVIGRNGSGKSTMGHVIAGVFSPDEGQAVVRGRANMLAPGAGFIPQLTGRENVLINGAFLGHNRKVMLDKMDEIIEFADIGRFIDQPVKTYSAGMRAKLGFSIALSLDPDILIIDELLSAGDAAFQQKAKEKLNELMERARAVIVIAHQLGFLKSICTEVLWLDRGHVAMRGEPESVIDAYEDAAGVKKAERAKTGTD